MRPADDAAQRPAEPSPTGPSGTVLVVDDTNLNRMLLVAQLGRANYRIELAEQGRQALAILRAQPIDVVLLDLLMPEMDGYELLAIMKADPALRRIPVIVISASNDMANVVRCIEMGAADYLSRPFSPVLLRARIDASLAAKRFTDQEAESLRQVARLAAAAAEIEAGSFDLASLDAVAARPDALGHLARVFQRMAREIDARERQLKQTSEVKTALIGKISHELRSPFVAAGFTVQLIQRYAEHNMIAQLCHELPQLERQLAAGRQMIDGIVAYASLVSRLSQQCREPTDLAALIHTILLPLQALAESHGVRLHFAPQGQIAPIMVDRTQIGEAIHHLVHNAIRFTPSGGQVIVSCWRHVDQLVCTVEDSGCGVDPAKLDTLWDAFAQEADEVRRGVAGLGLGLALVKCVVDAHGGSVLATSAPGEGSSFGFQIPIS